MNDEIKMISQIIILTMEKLDIVLYKFNKGEKLTFDDICLIYKARWLNLILQEKNIKI